MANSRIFLRNSFEKDLLLLNHRLVNLGVEYQSGKVYLLDLGTKESTIGIASVNKIK